MKKQKPVVVICAWFARCGRPATGTTSHPVLGEVPTCDRCRTFAVYRDEGPGVLQSAIK